MRPALAFCPAQNAADGTSALRIKKHRGSTPAAVLAAGGLFTGQNFEIIAGIGGSPASGGRPVRAGFPVLRGF
jgi:hypothetical protein